MIERDRAKKVATIQDVSNPQGKLKDMAKMMGKKVG